MTLIAPLCGPPPACEKPYHGCVDYITRLVPEYVGWDKWVDEIGFAAPGVLDDMAAYYARQAAIEFAKKTRVLRRYFDIPLQRCVTDYYPCPMDGERIELINQVCINGECMTPRRDAGCELHYCGWRVKFNPPNQIIVDGDMCTDHNGRITVVAHVSPTKNACEVDAMLFDRYEDAITQGALSRLYVLPGRKWTSSGLSDVSRKRFTIAMDRAKNDVARGFMSGKEMAYDGVTF